MSIQFINFSAFQKEAVDNFTFAKGPSNPTSLANLKKQLAAADGKLPTSYQKAIYEPFVAVVDQLTDADFEKIVNDEQESSFFFDFAQAIIQHCDGYRAVATGAFEEVVSDLYDGFLSAEDRRNIKIPNQSPLAPIVKWGNPEDGPYTLPADATAQLNVTCAIVNMPPSISKGVMAGWASLAHETAGHDISHSDKGLLPEMQQDVKKAILADKTIKNSKIKTELANYWSSRIDETSADIMGILNMGPAASIGTIPLFRAFLHRFNLPAKLRSEGPKDDEHPADILRVMLGSALVKLLSFSDASAWSTAILAEGLKDLGTIVLDGSSNTKGITVDAKSAQRSADIVAKILAQKPFNSLQQHALQEIQDWSNDDEVIVKGLRQVINGSTTATPDVLKNAYAAHVVAAGIYESLLVKQEIAPLFTNMLTLLKQMHDDNPAWGPLPILHRGDMKKDLMFQVYADNAWTNEGVTYPSRSAKEMIKATNGVSGRKLKNA
jgi:hypothetical protein